MKFFLVDRLSPHNNTLQLDNACENGENVLVRMIHAVKLTKQAFQLILSYYLR